MIKHMSSSYVKVALQFRMNVVNHASYLTFSSFPHYFFSSYSIIQSF